MDSRRYKATGRTSKEIITDAQSQLGQADEVAAFGTDTARNDADALRKHADKIIGHERCNG